MTIYQAQQDLREMLTGLYEPREAGNISDWVMEHITGMKKTDRLINKNVFFTEQQELFFQKASRELSAGRPVQYVLGEAWFMGMKFFVNESVLIPRPETEELVDWIVESSGKKSFAILDIGTGSGCIAVSVKKKLPQSNVTASDISENALQVAKQNAGLLQAEVDFLKIDFLDEKNWDKLTLFDIIVSNPPYIRQYEKQEMAKHVTDHEPSIALFVPDNDALVFYRKIASFAKQHLKKQGTIFLEINEQLGKETVGLYKSLGFITELRKDLQGRDRMVRAAYSQ